jgi:hypothetical protein
MIVTPPTMEAAASSFLQGSNQHLHHNALHATLHPLQAPNHIRVGRTLLDCHAPSPSAPQQCAPYSLTPASELTPQLYSKCMSTVTCA